MTAVRPFVNLEFYDFFVGVDKVLIIVLVFKPVVKGELSNVSSLLKLLMNMSQKVSYFFDTGPKVGLYFREYQHSVDFDLKGAMTREDNYLLFVLVVESLQPEA